MLNKQIAGELGIAEKTVKIHRSHMMHKMEAGSVAELCRDDPKARAARLEAMREGVRLLGPRPYSDSRPRSSGCDHGVGPPMRMAREQLLTATRGTVPDTLMIGCSGGRPLIPPSAPAPAERRRTQCRRVCLRGGVPGLGVRGSDGVPRAGRLPRRHERASTFSSAWPRPASRFPRSSSRRTTIRSRVSGRDRAWPICRSRFAKRR